MKSGDFLTFSGTLGPPSTPLMINWFLSREQDTSTWSALLLKTPVTLCEKTELLDKGAAHQVISGTDLEEVSSLWDRSVLTDVNQNPPDWIHVYRWNTWLLITYVSTQQPATIPTPFTFFRLSITVKTCVLLLVSILSEISAAKRRLICF